MKYTKKMQSAYRKINCDVLYIDPPYNSRQYSDAYHLLENLATWEKPIVHGKAKNGSLAYQKRLLPNVLLQTLSRKKLKLFV